MRNSLALGLAVAILKLSYADVIELDNQDAQVCKQQLLNTKADKYGYKFPVIVDYSPNCGACTLYLPIVEAASNSAKYKDRLTFFKIKQWDASDAVKKDCLGEGDTWAFPRTSIRVIYTNPSSGENRWYNPREVSSEVSTLEGLEKLLDLGTYSGGINIQ